MSETHDWSVATVEGISVPDVWTVMSLASISHLPDDVCRWKIREALKADPCGTPNSTDSTSDFLLVTATTWRRSAKYYLIKLVCQLLVYRALSSLEVGHD